MSGRFPFGKIDVVEPQPEGGAGAKLSLKWLDVIQRRNRSKMIKIQNPEEKEVQLWFNYGLSVKLWFNHEMQKSGWLVEQVFLPSRPGDITNSVWDITKLVS